MSPSLVSLSTAESCPMSLIRASSGENALFQIDALISDIGLTKVASRAAAQPSTFGVPLDVSWSQTC